MGLTLQSQYTYRYRAVGFQSSPQKNLHKISELIYDLFLFF